MILSWHGTGEPGDGHFSCPEQDALFNCLQGRWFCKDNSAVADIIGQVIVWDGGGTTLLHQRGNNTVWLKVGTVFFWFEDCRLTTFFSNENVGSTSKEQPGRMVYPPKIITFEDDFPFPKVGYVSSLAEIFLKLL